MKKIPQNSLKTLVPSVCLIPDHLVYAELLKHVGYQPFQRLVELYINRDYCIVWPARYQKDLRFHPLIFVLNQKGIQA